MDAGPAATGPQFRVATVTDALRLREAPKISDPPEANVRAQLPDGLVVRAYTGTPVNGFIEIEATLGGKRFRGFSAARYLVPITPAAAATVLLQRRLPRPPPWVCPPPICPMATAPSPAELTRPRPGR